MKSKIWKQNFYRVLNSGNSIEVLYTTKSRKRSANLGVSKMRSYRQPLQTPRKKGSYKKQKLRSYNQSPL